MNEVNVFENGFLQEFKNAQNNLAMNMAAGVNSFQNLGRPGQVTLPIFDGFATDSRVAAARSQLLNATETRDALLRNLEGEVRQTLLGYQEATEREALSRRAVESAAENLNLIQQKYNVGSATILDLIDSQVSLQRAASELVSALADIRVAEAAVDRVRGKGE